MMSWAVFKIAWGLLPGHTSPLVKGEATDLSGSISEVTKDPVATGGFCDLYLGHHRTHGAVALRRPRHVSYDDAILRRFVREIGLLCQIKHKNILPLLGTCTVGRDFYMVSPFMKSGDLRQWIRAGYTLNQPKILFQTADAIAHLHNIGIIHGDIKAQNILMSDTGSALLCDFGLAKVMDSMSTSTDVKGRGSFRWMAPELFDNSPKTKESDVYAFGMTVAEVLTGKAPLDHIHDYAVVTQVLIHNARPVRPNLEGESHNILWAVAEKCWAATPSDRPVAASIQSELGQVIQATQAYLQDAHDQDEDWAMEGASYIGHGAARPIDEPPYHVLSPDWVIVNLRNPP